MRTLFVAFVMAGLLGVGGRSTAAELDFVYEPDQSHISIAVHATADSFEGTLGNCVPLLKLDDAGRITAARIKFNFADVKTGKPKRDRAMHEWQDTPNFPSGEFILTTLNPVADQRWEAHGNLTFHGQTHELVFPVSITSTAADCAVDGEATIDTREFGLPVIRVMGLLKVDPLVKVRFHLQGKRGAHG